jgi:predicted lipoprotein with Yx(FWY)xxD motif
MVMVNLKTSATLGQYLTDQNGVSLYFYSNDYLGKNSCSGNCENYWPYFYAGTISQSNLATGLNLSDFDTIHVGTAIQTRYKGWPLYYYISKGNGVKETVVLTSGDGVDSLWFVAKPNYTIMLVNGQLEGANGVDYTSTYAVGTGLTIYMTDAKGLTLYTFFKDSFNINKYTNSTFSNNSSWPIYDTTSIVVPSVLNSSNFATTSVFGHMQLTYNGWPLYYYGPDSSKRGSNKGSGVGPGKWPVPVANMAEAPK